MVGPSVEATWSLPARPTVSCRSILALPCVARPASITVLPGCGSPLPVCRLCQITSISGRAGPPAASAEAVHGQVHS